MLVLKDFFNKNGYNFNDVNKWLKMATLSLLKIKAFKNKSYDVSTSVYDVINKKSSCESNFIVNVVMWPKFGNSRTSMR